MSDSIKGDLILGNAYRTFVMELSEHLGRAHDRFVRRHTQSDAEIQESCINFHTIKGGAGFFGLEEIARIAGKLEDILSEADAELYAQQSTISKLITELEDLAKEMPKPEVDRA